MRLIIALATLALVACFALPAGAQPSQTYTVYLPIVTASADSVPLSVGQTVIVPGYRHGTLLHVTVSSSARYDHLHDWVRSDYPIYPVGIFLVAELSVFNPGLESDGIGTIESIAVSDNAGRQFDLAGQVEQWAVMDGYNEGGIYSDVQPGMTRTLVFVFDVLPESSGMELVSLRPVHTW